MNAEWAMVGTNYDDRLNVSLLQRVTIVELLGDALRWEMHATTLVGGVLRIGRYDTHEEAVAALEQLVGATNA